MVIAVERILDGGEREGTGTIRLGVIDTGIGITEDVRERIFEPFSTTKPRGRGTGLGLAVVAAVVKEHGGQISLDSTPGQGTSVTLDLPAMDPVGAPNRTEAGSGAKVLIALADSYAADLLDSAVTGAGYQVRSVDSPSELKDAVRTDQSPCTRVLFLSGYVQDAYIAQALQVRAGGYTTKAGTPEGILRCVRKVLKGKTCFCPEVSSRLEITGQGVRLSPGLRTRIQLLTPRELDVLSYLGRGMSKKEIARTLRLSVKTVEQHCTNIMRKLDIHDRVQLARFAIREGLVRL